jgi:signal transduction histidine kinase
MVRPDQHTQHLEDRDHTAGMMTAAAPVAGKETVAGPAPSSIIPRPLIPIVVLAASLLLTTLASVVVWNTSRVRDRARFDNAVQAARDGINARLGIYIALLRATAGLFAAEEVSRIDFEEFIGRLDLTHEYPGVQGVGFTRRIPPDSVDDLEHAMRAEGVANFRVKPASARAEYHAIVYLEPLDQRNTVAIGYDMFTDPTRRIAMERARDRSEPAMSGKVELVQEIDTIKQAGFLIYVPVYAGGARPQNVTDRRDQLLGFAYSAFRAGDLFRGMFRSESSPRVAFRVYDGQRPDSMALLYDSGLPVGDRGGFWRETLRDTSQVEIAGRTWTLLFAPSQYFSWSSAPTLPLMMTVGLIVSVLLFLLTRAQQKARLGAERSAREAAALSERLRHSAEELRTRIAEIQALNVEAQAARAAAEEANRAKTQFVAKMSHELRTPLNAIAGYVDLMDLEIRGPVTQRQRHDLHRIRYAQQHLLGLINDVLNFAKLETGRVQLNRQEVAVRAAVQDVRMLIGPMAGAKGIAYVPAGGDDDVAVWADREKLDQILLNLLSNAVKFTDAGGQVEVAWERRDDRVDIHVRDSGRGIPAHKLSSIFEPFVQVDAELTSTTEGTGLGLAISRELAHAMDGSLSVESTEGVGSTFTLTLPASDAAPVYEPSGTARADQTQQHADE